MTKDTKDITQKILTALSEQIGVEEEELDIEDSFQEDLHMSPADLTDFLERLGEMGLDTSNIDLIETKRVEDLIETIISQEELI
ncbi:MAG: phosphopantetheine-binding protein [Patescibacteria group bacterium]